MTAPLVIAGSRDPVCGAGSYALTPDAALVVMSDGNGCVLDMHGEFYAISPIGAEMLRITLADGPRAASDAIAAKFAADPAQVAADLDALLEDMVRRGIVTRDGAAPSRRRGKLGAGIAAAVVRGLLGILRGPRSRATVALAAARISFGLFGWNATVDAWKRRLPERHGTIEQTAADAMVRSIDEIVRARAARMWLDVDCKERALSCLALARLAGLPASLVIGVDFYPLSGHCWCEVGDRVVSDDPANCRRYLPVFRYA
jgi:hypothetical protein